MTTAPVLPALSCSRSILMFDSREIATDGTHRSHLHQESVNDSCADWHRRSEAHREPAVRRHRLGLHSQRRSCKSRKVVAILD